MQTGVYLLLLKKQMFIQSFLALHIVDEGIASPEAVDDIVKYSLGRRWNLVGPIASADLGGLDVFKNISSYLYADLGNVLVLIQP